MINGNNNMKKDYVNYIFDLYGTLLDIHTDEEDPQLWKLMADKLEREYGALYSGDDLHTDYLNECKRAEKELGAINHAKCPEIRIEDVWARLIEAKSGQKIDPCSLKDLCIYFRETSRDRLAKYKDTEALLSGLKEKGRKIFLLSNAQRYFTEKELEDMDIVKYFDDIFISSDKGIKKPQKEFLEELIKKNGLNPSECVMIGNEIQSDGEVAKRNKMDYIIVTDGDFKEILF